MAKGKKAEPLVHDCCDKGNVLGRMDVVNRMKKLKAAYPGKGAEIVGVGKTYDNGAHIYLKMKCKCGVEYLTSEVEIGTGIKGCYYCRNNKRKV